MSLMEGVDTLKIADIADQARGADLRAMATEAGMFAIREERTMVYQKDFEGAAKKILMPEKRAEPADHVQQYI
jgi:proteasome regulatory subunit